METYRFFLWKAYEFVRLLCFNTTFSDISTISWRDIVFKTSDFGVQLDTGTLAIGNNNKQQGFFHAPSLPDTNPESVCNLPTIS